MANTNTALIVPELSLVRQADTNNGQPVQYPIYKIIKYTACFCDIKTQEEKHQNRSYRKVTGYKTVRPNQVIGRLHFPKAHSQKSKSWFYDKIDVIYDSWKSNGAIGWTNRNNSKRVVQFVLKPGVDPAIWLEIAKNFVASNIRYVKDTTRRLLEDLRKFLKRRAKQVSEVVKSTAIQVFKKVQIVVAQFVDSKPKAQPIKHPTQYLLSPASSPRLNITTTRDFISRFLNQQVITATPEKERSNPVPLVLPKRSDYNFTLKYKPKTYKRLAKYFKLDVQLSKDNAIDTFIQNCISPYAIKRALTPKRKR